MSLLPRLLFAVTLAVAFAAASSARAAAVRPNVVFVMTDDAGYGDFGCYGATDIRTPHVDRLAREGVRLTDFYAMPQCSPTRAALISGRYQQRVRIESALGSSGRSLELGLPANGRTLPRLLKNHGYATGLIGKWHLGYKPEFSPQAHGFDHAFGPLSGYVDFYHHVRADGEPDFFENGRPVTVEGYTTDLFTARATRFIEQRWTLPRRFSPPPVPRCRRRRNSTASTCCRSLPAARPPRSARSSGASAVPRTATSARCAKATGNSSSTPAPSSPCSSSTSAPTRASATTSPSSTRKSSRACGR
jgi:hypothetical protein